MAETNLTPHQASLASARKKLNQGADFENLSPNEQAAIEAEYSFVKELILSDDGLMKLFDTAVKQQWTPDRFKLEAEGTKWFSDRTASQEWYQIQTARKGPDGKPVKQKDIDTIKSAIKQEVTNQVVTTLGLDPNDPTTAAKIDEQAQYILENEYMAPEGWQNKVANRINIAFKGGISVKDVSGTIAKTLTDVRSTYRSMGMTLSEDVASRYAAGILAGTTNLANIQNTVRNDAAKMWKQFEPRILAGESLQNILYPYTQLVSSMLEVDQDSLDFTVDDPNKPAGQQIDPLLQKALFSTADPKNVMSLTDLRKAIKQDSRWQYTKNAKSEYATLTTQLMRMFGAGV